MRFVIFLGKASFSSNCFKLGVKFGMFGPRIPNVAKINNEEPITDVARMTFDLEKVLPISCEYRRVSPCVLLWKQKNLFLSFVASRQRILRQKKLQRCISRQTTYYNSSLVPPVQFSLRYLYPVPTLPKLTWCNRTNLLSTTRP